VLSPEFSSPDELIYLDHRVFTDALYAEMMPGSLRSRIYDYIFMCFLLGNDFLPHFPSLNIRTHGITTLLDIYSELCSKDSSMKFISMETGNIQWGYVKVFLIELAKLENASFIHEYESRHKFEKRYFPTETKEERMIAFDNIPVLYRDKEHYIRPGYPGWESRYYHVAFPENTNKKSICINYLEGLEWVFRYYTEGCPHWRWKYHYHYPPLFQDLIQYCPSNETFLIDEHCGTNTPLKPSTQLLYVIPKWNHSKLLSKKAQALTDKYSSFYIENPSELKFEWMFCRYFWEAHTLLPEISIPILEKIDKSF
jgi:5'-3' exonuclease